METNDIEVTITSGPLCGLINEINRLNAELLEVQSKLESATKELEDYKAVEAEREISIREDAFEECHRRTKLLELNERKNNAYREYHNKFGLALDSILKILEKRITKADELKIKFEKEKIEKAWQEFDKVQKEVNDLANEVFKQNPSF